MLVEVDSLTKKYKNKFALTDITFSLESKESIGIFGENGSGKTTLLKLIARLINPSKGNIKFSPDVINKTGTLIPGYHFLNNLSAKTNLEGYFNEIFPGEKTNSHEDYLMPADMHGFKLAEILKIKYKNLSLGMKQKINLTSVFNKKNLLLLLDEPTASLDIDGIEYLLALIKARQLEASFIIASHDFDFLNKCCNKIFFLKNGRFENEFSHIAKKEND